MKEYKIQFLRNNTLFSSFEEAYLAMKEFTNNDDFTLDGSPVLARYIDKNNKVNCFMGIINNIEGYDKSISIFMTTTPGELL